MKDKKKLGQEPAFPLQMEVIDRMPTLNINPLGISKRFYAACAAMQGILSAMPHSKYDTKFWLESMIEVYGDIKIKEGIVKESFAIADELLKQENE